MEFVFLFWDRCWLMLSQTPVNHTLPFRFILQVFRTSQTRAFFARVSYSVASRHNYISLIVFYCLNGGETPPNDCHERNTRGCGRSAPFRFILQVLRTYFPRQTRADFVTVSAQPFILAQLKTRLQSPLKSSETFY